MKHPKSENAYVIRTIRALAEGIIVMRFSAQCLLYKNGGHENVTAIFIFSLFYSLDFRHQLLSCYRQDLLQDPDLLRGEALRDP